jgi:hypothetical protein
MGKVKDIAIDTCPADCFYNQVYYDYKTEKYREVCTNALGTCKYSPYPEENLGKVPLEYKLRAIN